MDYIKYIIFFIIYIFILKIIIDIISYFAIDFVGFLKDLWQKIKKF
ncbi:hypothetical protein Desru_3189 [Desulforamulus ruminis DSM 2154]|uniref:Uncharacterized protein n=1 Tax=Desulforamulus ruminis (strain ATCC 23193 / DSM 2154 / NCIMB 8452 / DL) TaxID=696281 RepID=F6DV03_DESRL|nr:hypothetical protein Desru_3189 [Desulforamulus ruminis DSM 2154]